jgi:hypothetical protein
VILEIHLHFCKCFVDFFHYNLSSVLFFTSTVHCSIFQVEAYRDMINPVVDAFKYLTQVLAAYVMHVLWSWLYPFGLFRVYCNYLPHVFELFLPVKLTALPNCVPFTAGVWYLAIYCNRALGSRWPWESKRWRS